MNTRKDPEYFSERSRLVNLEGAFHDLTIFLGIAIFIVTGALIYSQIKETGIDLDAPTDHFLLMLGGLTLMNLGVFFLVRRYRSTWLAIESESGLDKVTGAMNRIHFEKLLEEELRRGGRYHYPITLCSLDIENFKEYNEKFGRGQGDQLLKQFSAVIRNCVRFADCVARCHNDEFCILLPHTDIVHAEKFMSRLSACIAEQIDFDFKAGVTSYQAGESKSQFMSRSLSALAQAKREKKQKIRYVLSETPAEAPRP